MDSQTIVATIPMTYDPESGRLYCQITGAEVGGYSTGKGRRYISVSFKGLTAKAHHLAWALWYGEWPRMAIDHRDGNPQNNAIGNLRLATNQQNQFNTGSKGRTSKYKGVSWKAADRKWQVRASIGGKNKHIGYFSSEIEAARAYDLAVAQEHGEFARPNLG